MKDNPSAQSRSYDYSKMIAATKKESQYKDFSSFISDKIELYRDKNRKEVHDFNRSTLAAIIGIDASTLTKIINGSQSTRKRDIVIALCFALQLSLEDTNMALNLYPMFQLNRCNLRDLVIEQALADRRTVSELNDILAQHNFPKLNLTRKKRKKDTQSFYYPLANTGYHEVSRDIQPFCFAGDDSALSLHERYHPEKYDSSYSEMIIKDDSEQLYQITLRDGYYKIRCKQNDEWVCLYCDEPYFEKYHHVPQCKDADLLNEIAKLQEYTDQKARYIHSMCADTKNYISRFDAINHEGKLIIYGETFGFDAPELCEYYQIEASQDGIVFTVSNCSKFMERYLGKDEWKRLYGPPLPDITHRYESLAEIPNQRWCSCFQSLINGAQDLLVRLQQKKIFLFDVNALWDIDDIMDTFEVKEAFSCIPSDDGQYDYIPKKEYIIGPDGKPITIDDLKRASELDIRTIEELCSIRKRYGSLEGFLQIDMLTEQKGQNNE